MSFGYGQMDKTSHKEAFTQALETEHTRYTTREVREEFSSKHGINNISENMDEARIHEKAGCNHKLTLADVDGKENPTTIAHMLSPDVVQNNVQMLIDEFPNNNYVKNNALHIYLTVVREHGEGNDICNKTDIMNEALSRLDESIGKNENNSHAMNTTYNELEDDYIPIHRH